MTKTETGTTLEHRIGARGRFSLRQASGDISVRGIPGDIVRVHSGDGRSLSDLFDIEVGDDRVELDQRGGLDIGMRMFGRGRSAELEIEVPHGATVSIATGSADIRASDLSGTKSFQTASGEVTLLRLAGGLEVETVSGEIDIDGAAPLDLALKSVSGDISVRVPSIRRLDVGTTSGDIHLDAELAGNGPFALRSISGDAMIVGRMGFRVEAETITGDLSSDQPSKRESHPGRKVLIVGRPGPTLTFRSVSGDLRVSEPRVAAARAIEAPASEDPMDDAAPMNQAPDATTTTDEEDKRLEILRALERGDITVAEATEQLTSVEEVLR
jgi:DUF4097 and DUF4098 domain-containing protein YvlB